MVDSIDGSKYIDRNSKNQKSKPVEIKFIPMSKYSVTRKMTTEPENSKRLNKSQKNAAQKVFQYEPIKKRVDRTIDGVPSSRQMIGKDRYAFDAEIGNGTFGTVFQARDKKTLETVAIKKVYQDKKYKNRELEILKIIDHPSILKMRDSFFTS